MEFKFIDPATDFSDGLLVLKSYHVDFLKRGTQLVALTTRIQQEGMTEAFANQCMAMYCHYAHATHLHHKTRNHLNFDLPGKV